MKRAGHTQTLRGSAVCLLLLVLASAHSLAGHDPADPVEPMPPAMPGSDDADQRAHPRYD